MSDLYTDIESNVLALLKAAPEFAGVATFEADLRECLFAGDKLSEGFRPAELPAINVSADRAPVRSSPWTAGEMAYFVTVTVVVVAKAQRKGDARAAVRELQNAVEGVLNQARKSVNGLGGDAVITGDLSTDVAVVEDRPHHFAIGEVTATVLKVLQL